MSQPISTFRRRLTAQSLLAFVLVMFGMVVVMLALYMPPVGEIHPPINRYSVCSLLLPEPSSALILTLNSNLSLKLSTRKLIKNIPMKPFELRLAQQHSQNARHVKNLRAFCDDHTRFSRLDPEDQSLILLQLEHMSALDDILSARMRRLNIPV